MAKEEAIELEGTVVECLPNALFRVKIDTDSNKEMEVMAVISGKMRRNNIRVLLGDRVSLDVTHYDLTRGRITYRFK
ncbi:hypothetical protein LCGC14_2765270 [marine sediment metagenome]|uniref:S1-like domain-containing protein n=1 Tax=marine sediment metagenome TaxID=412755 RepID=A0A0F9B6D8_9ZZZZ